MSSPSSDSRALGEPVSSDTHISISQDAPATLLRGILSDVPATSAVSAAAEMAAGIPAASRDFNSQGPITRSVNPVSAQSQPADPPNVVAGPSSTRGGRKAKAHVASACANCKRAHLSCDINRPCMRCVASGKQDSCHDVQHKKRGRPRLREEEEDFNVGSMVLEPTAQVTPIATTTQHSRHIAATRSRRAESFRSIQSMTSEDSSTYAASAPGFSPHTPVQARRGRQPWVLGESVHDYETPVAFLDLSLDILKANRAFEVAMRDRRSLRGLNLADIVMPADEHSFQTIRNQLRAEREAREPTYMPPILHHGQDLLGGITDAEADQLAQEYAENVYTWSLLGDGERHTFSARVKLAKASIYFVFLTLPSFRPVELQQLRSQQMTVPSTFFNALEPQLSPPRFEGPTIAQQMVPPLTPRRRPFPILRNTRQQQLDYRHPLHTPVSPASLENVPSQQHQTQPSIQSVLQPSARTSTTVPRTEVPVASSRSGVRDIIESVGRVPSVLQVPPIAVNSAQIPMTGSSGQHRTVQPGEVVSRRDSDDEVTEGNPKRRRRMGIDDVVHR
nr:transcription activator of gluconeogenesis ert1 [Quercus suber]